MPLQNHHASPRSNFIPSLGTFTADNPATASVSSRQFAAKTLSSAPSSVPNSSDALIERRTLRTYMRDSDGRLLDAKINLETGEVVQHQYVNVSIVKTSLKANEADVDPPWVRIAAPASPAVQVAPPSRKRLHNHLRGVLSTFMTLQEAIDCYPALDDWFQGALHLDLGGNTRPLNPTLLFHVLQYLEVIDSRSVQSFTGHSLRHAQRIVQVLNIILSASKQSLSVCSKGDTDVEESV